MFNSVYSCNNKELLCHHPPNIIVSSDIFAGRQPHHSSIHPSPTQSRSPCLDPAVLERSVFAPVKPPLQRRIIRGQLSPAYRGSPAQTCQLRSSFPCSAVLVHKRTELADGLSWPVAVAQHWPATMGCTGLLLQGEINTEMGRCTVQIDSTAQGVLRPKPA